MSILIFLVSLIGIIALFAFRGWEIDTNTTVAAGVRAKLDERTLRNMEDISVRVPSAGKHIASVSTYHAREITHRARLKLVEFIERRLLSIVDLLRGKKVIKREIPPSSFLKIVSEHKRENSQDKK